jgi:hypothetical protein
MQMALLSYGLPCATGARLSWSIPFPAPIVSDHFLVCNDVGLAQQTGNTVLYRRAVGRKSDMNGILATFEKIRIPDLPHEISDPLLTGQILVDMDTPNIYQFFILNGGIFTLILHLAALL